LFRSFEVRKRAGGARTIAAPRGALRLLQVKLLNILSEVFDPRESVHGFVRDRSIVTNADRHKGRPVLLNVDLQDFFPSINFGRVRGVFMAKPYSLPPNVATVLAQLCCLANQLPQGAPTSPIIANMVCARLDGQLQRLAKATDATYTRYADDIT